MNSHNHLTRAFTLIELSIVIVIIGLIVGGVLVGRDLITTAALRAQVSQINKYQQSMSAFRGKYGYYPGDVPQLDAQKYGFSGVISGNGDGLIDTYPQNQWLSGEYNMVWYQLGMAGLSESYGYVDNTTDASGSGISRYLPSATLGSGMYLYAWGRDYLSGEVAGYYFSSRANNFITIASVNQFCGVSACGLWLSYPRIKVSDAAAIDSKIDDGFPQSGNVLAAYLGNSVGFGAASALWAGETTGALAPASSTIVGSSTTCFDTGGVSALQKLYSIGQNNGSGANCALSFRF